MSWTIAGIACGSAIIAAIVFFALRLRVYWAPAVPPAAEFPELSLSRYEPMARLLSRQDIEFLKTQPGYRPEIARKLQRTRRRVFRSYLVDLAAEFRSLHALARHMVASAGAQDPALVSSLFRQQFTFWRAIAAIELRLMTSGLGFAGALSNVNVGVLIDAMNTLRAEMARLTPAPTAA